jgi:signal transduction histidine kinase
MTDSSIFASVLIVDDDAASLMATRALLETLGAKIVVARSGEEALLKVLEHDFAAILLDVHMPGIDGFTTAKMIRERKRSRYTPIIFVTAASPEDLATMFRGYQSGAVDYIVKPVIPEVLRTKLSVFIGIHDMTRMLNAELGERALTEERLRASEERLRSLASHLQTVREEERTMIARDIHDDLGQALTALKLDINGLVRAVDNEDFDGLQDRSKALSNAIDKIINSVRRISSGLRPEVLDEIGVSAAIEWQAREFQRRTGIRCNVSISSGFTDPDMERSTALFRIFQELLTNVARHAKAARVNVKLEETPDICLVVEDNGRGILESEFKNTRALGFVGMRERVLQFGGSIEVSGAPGKGTKVRVAIPVTVQQPEYHA